MDDVPDAERQLTARHVADQILDLLEQEAVA